MRKESHVAAALKYIEENLPVGEDGLYGLVNNAGVRHHVGDVVVVVVHRDAIVVVVVIVSDVTVLSPCYQFWCGCLWAKRGLLTLVNAARMSHNDVHNFPTQGLHILSVPQTD